MACFEVPDRGIGVSKTPENFNAFDTFDRIFKPSFFMSEGLVWGLESVKDN